jgi:hypothetical protein
MALVRIPFTVITDVPEHTETIHTPFGDKPGTDIPEVVTRTPEFVEIDDTIFSAFFAKFAPAAVGGSLDVTTLTVDQLALAGPAKLNQALGIALANLTK